MWGMGCVLQNIVRLAIAGSSWGSLGSLGLLAGTTEANMTDYSQRIFHRVDQELAEEFITDEGLFMKFTGDMRKVP